MARQLKTCRRKTQDDEFYTLKKDVEKELSKWDLSGKKIICNCDKEFSNIYIYIKEHGYIVDNEPDEWRNVDYSKYDIVITNPPFKDTREMIKYLISINKNFLIIVSDVLRWSIKKGKFNLNSNIYAGNGVFKFNRPDGTIKAIHCGWISNIQDTKKENKLIWTKQT